MISVEGIENNAPEDKLSSYDLCKDVDQSKTTNNPFTLCEIYLDGSYPGAIIPTAGDTEDLGVPEVKKDKKVVYEYVWISSEKGVEFNPSSGKDPQVKVTFGNIGNVEIWAEVHKDGEYIGDTERIKTKVIPPKFTLTVKPEAPYIAEESVASIKVEPDIDDKYLNFRWLPMGKNVQELGESDGGRSYRLRIKNNHKSTIEVLVWAEPYAKKQIADLKQVISGKPYKVDVKVLGPLGPKPMVWKEGKGLVEVEGEIAIHQNVRLKATVEPKPKSGLHYAWTLNEDSHFSGGDWGTEVTVNRSQVGPCVATVTVKDGDGNVLGKGSASFSVIISQQIDKGKRKAKDQQKAKELLQEGRKLWEEGKLQQAIAKVAQAQRVVGKDKEITKTLNAMHKQKKEIDNKKGKEDKSDASVKTSDNKAGEIKPTPLKDTEKGSGVKKEPTKEAAKDNNTATVPTEEDTRKREGSEGQEKKVKHGAGGSVSGMFPAKPFNGLQISYSFSGASMPKMEDTINSRRYEGHLGDGTMTLSGTARVTGATHVVLHVSVSAGREYDEKRYNFVGPRSKSFNLSIPIPKDATGGGFNINMGASYGNGEGRGLSVSGNAWADGPEGESPKGTEELTLEITAPKDQIPISKKVDITAQISGGRFPYTYTWSGAEGKEEKVETFINYTTGAIYKACSWFILFCSSI